MPINKDKLELREKSANNRPEFARPGIVKVGYGGPKIARGLHPSGYTDNLVFNLNDIEKFNPKTDGLRIGHSVGTKKRKEIIVKAIEKKFKVFNARVSASGSKS